MILIPRRAHVEPVNTKVRVHFLKGENPFHRRTLHMLVEDDEDMSNTEIIVAEIIDQPFRGLDIAVNFIIMKICSIKLKYLQ